jgi:hypothetical protein
VTSRKKTITTTKRVMPTVFYTGTNLLLLDVILREENFNQKHFMAMIASKLSREKTNAKQRVGLNNWLSIWTIPHVIMGADLRVFWLANTNESFTFSSVSRSLTV